MFFSCLQEMIAGRRAATHLIRALRSTDDWIAASAAEGLGRLGDPRACGGLVEAVVYRSAWVSLAAGNSLVRIGISSLGPLRIYKNDSNPRTRARVHGIVMWIRPQLTQPDVGDEERSTAVRAASLDEAYGRYYRRIARQRLPYDETSTPARWMRIARLIVNGMVLVVIGSPLLAVVFIARITGYASALGHIGSKLGCPKTNASAELWLCEQTGTTGTTNRP